MEHHLRSAARRPAHGLRIPPPLVTDDDAERQRTGSEDAPLDAGNIGGLLQRVDLDLVLEARDRSVAIDDQSRGPQRALDDLWKWGVHENSDLKYEIS